MAYCVPSETVIGQDDDGKDMFVTDIQIVNRGNKWWVTQPVFERIKAKTAKQLT